MLQLLSLFDLKRVSSLVIDQIGAMKTFRNIHALSIFLILGSSTLVKAQDSISVGGDFGKDIKPILQQYCYDCHGLKKTKGKEINQTIRPINIQLILQESGLLPSKSIINCAKSGNNPIPKECDKPKIPVAFPLLFINHFATIVDAPICIGELKIILPIPNNI